MTESREDCPRSGSSMIWIALDPVGGQVLGAWRPILRVTLEIFFGQAVDRKAFLVGHHYIDENVPHIDLEGRQRRGIGVGLCECGSRSRENRNGDTATKSRRPAQEHACTSAKQPTIALDGFRTSDGCIDSTFEHYGRFKCAGSSMLAGATQLLLSLPDQGNVSGTCRKRRRNCKGKYPRLFRA